MEKRSKILPRVLIVLLIVALISTLVLSSVYAKYVSEKDPDEVASRPAAFELIMKTPLQDSIDFNFAVDGEPGTAIGHTEVQKHFDFAVKTSSSEVAATYRLEIKFSKKIADLIRKGEKDKLIDPVSCTFFVQKKDGNTYVNLPDAVTDDGVHVNRVNGEYDDMGKEMIWTYTTTIEPHKNPDGSSGTDSNNDPVMADYRLVMEVYNNTMMPAGGNVEHYVLSTNGIEISVTSTQENSGFVGQFAGK